MVQPHPHGKARAKSNEGRHNRGRARNVNHLWIILGNVNHVRFRRHNDDFLLAHLHFLLRGAGKIPGRLGFGPQLLDRRHHIHWLIHKRISDRSRPRKVFVHPFQNIRVMGERLHAGIPRLLFNGRRIGF